MAKVHFAWLLVFLFIRLNQVYGDFYVREKVLTVPLDGNNSFILENSEALEQDVEVFFNVEHPQLIKTDPSIIKVPKDDDNPIWNIVVQGLHPGFSLLSVNVTPNITDFSDAFVRVTVERSSILYHVSSVVGWIYFLAWSVSFYPQIYTNYKRKSVIGLSFDFCSLNLLGFILYTVFNCGLLYIPEIEHEYFIRHPKGLNPVQINDIFFAVHAIFATMITIIQCFIYERGNQRVSTTAKFIHAIFLAFILVTGIMAKLSLLAWLDFLYGCSYVKLAITLIKYVPQAFYNYKRQSTVGWSIGNILLDFIGGILSMLQMILNAINYDDWESVYGDVVKFSLGLFSVAFDILFFIQHYVLYRKTTEYKVNEKKINLAEPA